MEARAFDVPKYLALLPLFNALSPDELREVAAGSTLRRLTRGEIVFRAGDPCNEFFVIVTGQVKLFMLAPSGQEKVVEVMGARPCGQASVDLGSTSAMAAARASALSARLVTAMSGTPKRLA